MPKVVFVANWDWVLYNFRLPVVRALQNQGCDVVLVCPRGKYVEQFTAERIPHVEWRLERRSLNPLTECQAIVHLTRIYRRERPDLVHHFTLKPNLYGSLAARLARVPVVVNTFSGLGFVFSHDLRARLLRIPLGVLMRWGSHRDNTWTIFENTADRDTLCASQWVASARVCVIPGSSADVRRFSPRNGDQEEQCASTAPAEPTVLLASRLLRDKGIAEFTGAARLLHKKGIKARFWVAGEPDSGNLASISDAELRQWQEEGDVEFLGHRSDMPDLLRRADIAVLPTSYFEGVPKFLVEAAATGLPLVASDIPGCRMVVEHEVNGFLVPPCDATALAQALGQLLADAPLRTRFGEASRRLAIAEFSEEKIVGEYLALYRQLGILDQRLTAEPCGWRRK